ncbi:aldehyde dehydrogenase (NADP(+)) [Membranicola marinus]|uniref:Aldehyde dehydrogenase (NADP(+)) n=1 Tax=Membranihabitans marinus TaxID=1227546 RepID=A0A953HJI4_9BACT|nr:aldehyde dehydrogenase (NADP(+)) [Membranihabitans marinus]MBY5956872.1 aldehyde dehydrogenase (NADP(+)) [Membranihabitans marinus]
MKIQGQQIIGLTLEQYQNGDPFYPVNPNTGEEIKSVDYYNASTDHMNQAIQLAAKAHADYKNTTAKERAEFLRAIAREIENIGPLLTDTAGAETGLPDGRLNGERGRTVGQLNMFADWIEDGAYLQATIDEAMPDRTPMPRSDLRKVNQPIGPVVVFGASNFPLAFSVAGGDTASALAAGCPVVVKGHPAHPGTSELVGKAIQEAARKTNMPDGVFSMVQGNTHEVGQYLVMHPRIKAVGFTGSFGGGKALYDLAQTRPTPIPVYAEMGSTNPVFILPGALKARGPKIAAGLAGSINLGAGQFCTNPGVFMVPDSDESENFTQDLQTAFTDLDSQTMLTPGIHSAYTSGTSKLRDSGAFRVLAQGQSEENKLAGRPTLFQARYADVKANALISEEVFGPASIMVTSDSTDEILEFAKSLDGHLTATIHAEDSDSDVLDQLIPVLQEKVGRIIFNGYPTGVEVCHAMVHGGPFPATTDSSTTSVGTSAIYRFLRPVCYQDIPDQHLPDALKRDNPLGIPRLVNGKQEL